MSGIKEWVTSPWGVKPKAGKINENNIKTVKTHTSPSTPTSSGLSSSSSTPGSSSTTPLSSSSPRLSKTPPKNMKVDVWSEISEKSTKSPSGTNRDHFIPNNPIEDALKVSYKKEISPQQEIRKNSSSYSSATHLNSTSKKSSAPNLYQDSSKLKSSNSGKKMNSGVTFNKQSNDIILPTQIRKTPLSEQLNTMKEMVDENYRLPIPDSSNVSSYILEQNNPYDSDTDNDALYHSDDESDTLRSLPSTAPFLNTELSGDFDTEYDENDPFQDVQALQKKPSAPVYSGNALGAKQSQTISRKVRSHSPFDAPQTIKVEDEFEELPVSQQKRAAPISKAKRSTSESQSPSSISESRSGDDAKEKQISTSLPTKGLPPPPPPPQPQQFMQSLPPKSEVMMPAIEFDSDLLIDRNEINLVHKIGEGFFGEVWKAKWNQTQDIAVKKMKHEATNSNDRNTFLSEVYSLAKLRHPNITVFYGVTSPPDAFIISELLSGSLFQLIHGYKSNPTPINIMFPLPVILRILRDVASGGSYLHKRKPPIIHRDLSSSNVLLSVSATSTPDELLRACADENRPVAKLTDFGLSRNVDWYMTSCVGNLFYLAPEVFSGDHYTQSADVYSYGILIWELVSRVSPYPSESPQRAAFLAATRGLRPSHNSNDSRTPPELSFLRDKCWHGDPAERPTFNDVLLKLGEMMTSGKLNSETELTLHVKNITEGQYSDQFSTVPDETLSHLWDRKCRNLSNLLLRKPDVDILLQRRILLSHPDPNYIPPPAPPESTTSTTPLKSQKKSITIPQKLAKQRLVAKSMK